MKRLIRVELKDGTLCRMAVKAFNVFLAHDRVARFERSDGWAEIDRDPLRDMTRTNNYEGPERRMVV